MIVGRERGGRVFVISPIQGGGDLHIRLDDFVCFQGRKEDVEDPEEDEDAGGNGLDALQQVQVKVGGILWDQSP